MNVATVEFNKTRKRLDAKILFAITFWPMLLSILAITGSGFFQASGDLVGALDFVGIMIDFQDLIVLPLLVSVYICSMTFYQEMHQHQIYFYKDISRTKVLHAKYTALLWTYTIFFIAYALNALLSYYAIFQFTPYANRMWVSMPDLVQPLLFEALQLYFIQLFYIHIGLSLALRYNTGVSIFGTILIYLFIKTTPYISWAKHLTPAGFREVIDFGGNNLLKTLALSLFVWLLYNVPMYLMNRNYFKNVDFS